MPNEPRREQFLFGIALPIGVFVVYHLLLLLSAGGRDYVGFPAMLLMYGSLIIIPGLFIANSMLMFRQWKNRSTILLLGFALPTIVAVFEYRFLYRN